MSDVDLGVFGYDVERQRRGLQLLHDRYFRPVIAYKDGHLTHHGDCEIHRCFGDEWSEPYAYCSCGFFHDLRCIDGEVVYKLYDRKKYYEELGRHAGRKPGDPPAITDEEMEALFAALERQGVKRIVATPEQEAVCNERDWKLIGEVFGEAFRDRRKKEWLEELETDA